MAITNLTNTNWTFKEKPTYAISGSFNINFVNNDKEFTRIGLKNMGAVYITYYNDSNDESISVCTNGYWKNEVYKTITITGGDDVENATLIEFLEANTLKAPEFTETKTALKIYEDLTQEEFNLLEKDNNSFYLVNDVGVYKGEKLIAEKNKPAVKIYKHDIDLGNSYQASFYSFYINRLYTLENAFNIGFGFCAKFRGSVVYHELVKVDGTAGYSLKVEELSLPLYTSLTYLSEPTPQENAIYD